MENKKKTIENHKKTPKEITKIIWLFVFDFYVFRSSFHSSSLPFYGHKYQIDVVQNELAQKYLTFMNTHRLSSFADRDSVSINRVT